MNYKRIYDELIAYAQSTTFEGYTERHHIIPTCLGGSDDASNLVVLSAQEHFLAHLLLAKIHGGIQLWYAVIMLKRGAANSRLYEIAKKGNAKAASNALKGKPLSQSNRDGLKEAWARPGAKARRGALISAAKKGVPASVASKLAISAGLLKHGASHRAFIAAQQLIAVARREEDLRLEKAHFEALRYYRHAA